MKHTLSVLIRLSLINVVKVLQRHQNGMHLCNI